MTNLSPAAQAVLDAYANSILSDPHGYKIESVIAAALRAVADQWKNEICEQPNTEFVCGIKNCIDALDDIAAELKDSTDD